ncbi:MAG TPA: hypothetical protein VKV21_04335 [Solirubrobacteraceae bacterium]|nr:hypothetical protein [Solirubrobacteraceae bacterium]
MSLTSYILDSALVLIVLLQIREKALSTRTLLLPLAIVGVAVSNYFTTLPTAGNDLVLIAATGLFGLLIGTASGGASIMRLRPTDGAVTVRAGWLAGFLWVLGMGLRFAFAVWVSHSGAATIGRFSAAHAITGGAAWTDALLLMALAEVAGRTAVLAARRQRVLNGAPALAA